MPRDPGAQDRGPPGRRRLIFYKTSAGAERAKRRPLPAPPAARAARIEHDTGDVGAFREALGLEWWDVLGHSWGAASPRSVRPSTRKHRPSRPRRPGLAPLRREGYDWRERVRGLAVPTLVLHGEEDRVPLRAARATAALLGDARLVPLPSAGHLPFRETPEPFLSLVEEFLDAAPSTIDSR